MDLTIENSKHMIALASFILKHLHTRARVYRNDLTAEVNRVAGELMSDENKRELLEKSETILGCLYCFSRQDKNGVYYSSVNG